jgi:seryl-tRNA synthetase
MTAPAPTDLEPHELARAGLAWREDGQAILSGPILRLAHACDQAFVDLATAWNATEERHPPFLSVDALHRLDYFRSFPHLATFPVCLDDQEANLAAFTEEPVGDDGTVQLTGTRPTREVLTPAACYQLYIHHAGERLDGPLHLTVRNTCFRREHEYRPLRRQWAFDMREVVCVGRRDEVEDFLGRSRAMVDALVGVLGLPVRWEVATDPFFQPTSNARYLLQRVSPTKHELVYNGHLAIGSVNLHHDHFGATFDLRRDGEPATSGCVAFGLERWLYAIIHRFGADPVGWPELDDATTAAVAARGSPEEG